MQDTVTINMKQFSRIAREADRFLLEAEFEDELIKLLEVQEQIDKLVEEAKDRLKTAAMISNPHFKSIQGDRVKVSYREFGPRYVLNEANTGVVAKDLYFTQQRHKLDIKAVDKYIEETGRVPIGIAKQEREKRVVFRRKDV